MREVVANGQAQFLGHLPATQTLHLEVVLRLRHEPELDNFLQELYDPSSPLDRQFLTVEEFTARFAPSQEDYDAVARFAKTNGFEVAPPTRNRMNVGITGTVSNIEKAFHVNMGVYKHPTENRKFYAPDREPTIDLPFQLWAIGGIDNYSTPRPMLRHNGAIMKPNAATGSCPQQSFCGSDMRAAYYGGTTLNGAGQSVGLLEFNGANISDLQMYYKNIGQTLNVPITFVSTDGTPTDCIDTLAGWYCDDDSEPILDMTQVLGMAPSLSSLVVYVGSLDFSIFEAMATAKPLNAQLSSSWMWQAPIDPTQDDPYFKEFAAQGQNLFQASGDTASWYPDEGVFPADDDYVVSVGGTKLTTRNAGGSWASETAWQFSGGGISTDDLFPIPSWQVAAAAGCTYCSKTYRNAPDVAAEANTDFYLCANGSCTANENGGTSFAAPMWAGYLALANQQAVANGQQTLGFINPALYAIGMGPDYDKELHDITSGNNGFPATVGYDLVTGWGSPNGANLINALVGQQGPSFGLTAKPNKLTIKQGASGASTITVTFSGGFSGSVVLKALGLPKGVRATFGTNPTISISTLTLAASSTATTGPATITITGTSGKLINTTTISLTVDSGTTKKFALSASPTTVKVKQGDTGTSTVTITPVSGFTGSVALTAKGLPNGVTASFNPKSATSSSVLTVTASATAKGTATVTIRGTSGSLSATTAIKVTVTGTATPTVNLMAAPKTPTIPSDRTSNQDAEILRMTVGSSDEPEDDICLQERALIRDRFITAPQEPSNFRNARPAVAFVL